MFAPPEHVGQVVLAGGWERGIALPNVEIVELSDREFRIRHAPNFAGGARSWMGAASAGSKAIFAGGWTGSYDACCLLMLYFIAVYI